MKKLLLTLFAGLGISVQAQYWQQSVDYTMDITMNVENHQYDGYQKVQYTNNSPDTLQKAYFHLYFNAFQPGSMMDVRSRTIKDPDRRVTDRIHGLESDEVGFQEIRELTQNGMPLGWEVNGTVLKCTLAEPLLPGESTTFEMRWNAQVPKQIRRSGWNNKEGVEFTMTQWYPKLAEYDEDGWHPDQYVGREFYGVWGTFDVTVHIDKSYVLGGTGYLQNPEDVGFGYGGVKKVRLGRNELRTWHFKADRVHDFAFAADPDYKHVQLQIENGPLVHLLYDPKTANEANWIKIQDGYLQGYFDFMAQHFGKYPYEQFSLIQGGDGGMEYPMCTMMLGGGDDFEGFTGLFVHEGTHNWYYGVIGTNEAAYPWMDEGFTSYAEEECMNVLFSRGQSNPHLGAYRAHDYLDTSGLREPLSTPADHFNYNRTYGINSYSAGALFLNQLEYIIGEEPFARGMKRYWAQWQFKHPKPEDFIRIMERESDLELDWYLSYYVDQVKSIDYSVSLKRSDAYGAEILLERKGLFPMPVDLRITYASGRTEMLNIPLVSMYGAKRVEGYDVQSPWAWTHPEYILKHTSTEPIISIEIDPSKRLLDIDRANNIWSAE
ncbi:MAG: M1 family metallopeptidase [Schleiferiaceae bacterium]|nr:M1 family metallopeptidase [Schleiferiaceae bacterium]